MSRRKFAAIRPDLLARKGEAAPWLPAVDDSAETAAAVPNSVPHANLAALQAAFEAPANASSADADRPKRCTLKLSQPEYERLGILAAKKGHSRHHLLRLAFEQFMSGAAAEYNDRCECLAAGDRDGAC